jgi:hypothetical protein
VWSTAARHLLLKLCLTQGHGFHLSTHTHSRTAKQSTTRTIFQLLLSKDMRSDLYLHMQSHIPKALRDVR